MSRRSERAREGKTAREAARAKAASEAGAGGRAAGAGGREGDGARAGGWSLRLQLLFLIAVFAATTGIAALAGAANFGTALGIGQIAFALAVVYLLVRR